MPQSHFVTFGSHFVTFWHIWVTVCDIWVTVCDIWVTVCDIWVTFCDIWVTVSEISVTACDVMVTVCDVSITVREYSPHHCIRVSVVASPAHVFALPLSFADMNWGRCAGTHSDQSDEPRVLSPDYLSWRSSRRLYRTVMTWPLIWTYESPIGVFQKANIAPTRWVKEASSFIVIQAARALAQYAEILRSHEFGSATT